MLLPLNGLVPNNQIGFLTRAEGGSPSAWVASYEGATMPVDMPMLSVLGRDQYRLIGKEDGSAMVNRFADLHRHSYKSLLDSIIKIPDMVKKTEYAGALTDHGNMYGFLEYYLAMKDAGKKPILGFEGYMIDSVETRAKRYHVVLLAKNNQGYKNLVKLTSEAYDVKNFYSYPLISWEMLEQYHEGVICLSACVAGIIPQALLEGDLNKAKEYVEKFISIFGKEDFYIEIQNHHISDEDLIRPMLINLANEYGLKYVATTDSHYVEESDREAHQIVLCLHDKRTISDPNKRVYPGEGYYLHDSEMMEKRFADYPEALDASLDIADKCDVTLELNKVNLPNYDIPAPFANADEYMLHLAKEGFKTRFEGTPHYTDPEYISRFNYEADMIKKMGFSAYFVIIWDFINYARQQNISVGPGRGSAAGSMVAYCMGITDMDPIQYKLLFERFLNPERVSMPDIDTDIAHRGRPKVFQYMVDKYGKENVCRIITFGTFAPKQALKDVARVLDFPASVGNRLSSMLKDPKCCKTLDMALASVPDFAFAYKNNEDDRRIIDLAKKIEGCARHASLHACGLVVAPSMVSDYLPTCTLADDTPGSSGRVVASQVEKEEVEKLSLIKMDLLGLKNLSAIDESLESAQRNYGKQTILDKIQSNKDVVRFQDIPLGDRETYQMLRSGVTGAVFQLESPGMTRVIKDMLSDLDQIPDDKLGDVAFERLIAAVALYRPGPMDYIPEYVAGLRDASSVHYDCPEEEEILSSTYGVLVYQEQLMQIAQKLAGYTLGQADVLRKACGKKKKDVMAKEHDRFIPGCVKNGISQQTAERIWEKMTKFAEYAFNRSHAACYAWVGYITAYLSCHYPVEFYAAMLNAFIEDSKKENAYLAQANGRGITIQLPNVQESEGGFTAKPEGILFGLRGISGVKTLANEIIKERNKNGLFVDFQDFYTRIMNRGSKMSRKTLESLIYAGAFRQFTDNKAALMALTPLVEKDYKQNGDGRSMGQISLFADADRHIPLPDTKPFTPEYEREKEFSVLGLYLTSHPADVYEAQIKGDKAYVTMEELSEMAPSADVVQTIGMVRGLKTFLTKKKGEEMCAFTLETKFSSISCVMFPKYYQNGKALIQENAVLCAKGSVQEDNRDEDSTQFSVREVSPPDVSLMNGKGGLVIPVRNKAEQDQVLAFVRENPGYTRITLKAYDRLFPLNLLFNATEQNKNVISAMIGTTLD